MTRRRGQSPRRTYDSPDELRTGLGSEDGGSVIADLTTFATGGVTMLIADGD